ncbi:hypothetical protein CF327_g6195 [Tilletia walkeri]|nr:hypothetical protein CF327_g6195 [Tilletia walkeri]
MHPREHHEEDDQPGQVSLVKIESNTYASTLAQVQVLVATHSFIIPHTHTHSLRINTRSGKDYLSHTARAHPDFQPTTHTPKRNDSCPRTTCRSHLRSHPTSPEGQGGHSNQASTAVPSEGGGLVHRTVRELVVSGVTAFRLPLPGNGGRRGHRGNINTSRMSIAAGSKFFRRGLQQPSTVRSYTYTSTYPQDDNNPFLRPRHPSSLTRLEADDSSSPTRQECALWGPGGDNQGGAGERGFKLIDVPRLDVTFQLQSQRRWLRGLLVCAVRILLPMIPRPLVQHCA